MLRRQQNFGFFLLISTVVNLFTVFLLAATMTAPMLKIQGLSSSTIRLMLWEPLKSEERLTRLAKLKQQNPKMKPEEPKLKSKQNPIKKPNPLIKPPEQIPKVEGQVIASKNLSEMLLPEPSRLRSKAPERTNFESLPDNLNMVSHRKRIESHEFEGSLETIRLRSGIKSASTGDGEESLGGAGWPDAFSGRGKGLASGTLSLGRGEGFGGGAGKGEGFGGGSGKGERRGEGKGEGKGEGRGSNYVASDQILLPSERPSRQGIQPKNPGYIISGEVAGRKVVYQPPDPEVKSGETGEVELRFWVASDGSVFNVIIKKKAGFPLLDRLAREYMEKWRFAELDKRFEPRNQWGDITIDYTRFKSR